MTKVRAPLKETSNPCDPTSTTNFSVYTIPTELS